MYGRLQVNAPARQKRTAPADAAIDGPQTMARLWRRLVENGGCPMWISALVENEPARRAVQE
jgi:hypothetical protein